VASRSEVLQLQQIGSRWKAIADRPSEAA